MKTTSILLATLVAQSALAVVTWWPSAPAVTDPVPLVPGGNAITALTITPQGDDAEPVDLVAEDGRWFVASSHRYPADPDKVAEVLDMLAGAQLRTPIATQAIHHDTLKVGEHSADKQLRWTADGETATWWVGAAARQAVHLRKDGTDDVYAVTGLSAWSIRDTARAYLPNQILQIDPAQITSLAITNAQGAVSFARREDGWEAQGDTPMAARADEVDTLARKLGSLRLQQVVGTEVLPEHGLAPGTARVTWTVHNGDQDTPGGLVIGAEQGGDRVVRSDADGFVVTVPSSAVTPFLEADPARLLIPLEGSHGFPTEGP